ncbi:hypothetical protein BC629DRAFT_376519 [Irpex lacteus]|nr:hypothetical protein BC629DRAFT_376519 [Irpex lacteus]
MSIIINLAQTLAVESQIQGPLFRVMDLRWTVTTPVLSHFRFRHVRRVTPPAFQIWVTTSHRLVTTSHDLHGSPRLASALPRPESPRSHASQPATSPSPDGVLVDTAVVRVEQYNYNNGGGAPPIISITTDEPCVLLSPPLSSFPSELHKSHCV